MELPGAWVAFARLGELGFAFFCRRACTQGRGIYYKWVGRPGVQGTSLLALSVCQRHFVPSGWHGKGGDVHIMAHFTKTLDTIDPGPIESSMAVLHQALARARRRDDDVDAIQTRVREPARSDLRACPRASVARQALQNFQQDEAALKDNASATVDEATRSKLQAARQLWQRGRLTKLEFQAGRVLLRSKKKKSKLMELQTQFIQETGQDPKAEAQADLYKAWAAALTKP